MSPRRSVQTGRRNAYADSPSIQRSLANGGFLQEDVAKPSIQRPSGLGRIQPFRPGGTFEAFGRTARDIGQSTPFRPMGGCSPPKVVTLGVERPPKLLTNPHFSPGVLRMFKASQISCHAAGTRSSAGFLASREPLRGRTFSSSPSTHLKLPQKLSPFC